VAERTGLTVVSGFRQRDTAAGGEGAPLVAIVDWWLGRSDEESRALVNLGGMANVTFLPRGAPLDAVRAFDTGPANAVIDALAVLASDGAETRDEGGRRGGRGSPSEALLVEALADPFFAQPPPRSTGRERFGQAYAERLRAAGRALGLSDDDLVATAVELTAASIAHAFDTFGPDGGIDTAYLSGGGVRNPTLVAAITRRLRADVRTAEDLGLPSDFKEALAFAFLAHQTLCGGAGNVPGATGADRPVPLGHITPGAPR
jgi:anhydro-N-acetylmuramic acid kinase